MRVRDYRFPWPEGMLVRVPPDNHPGNMLPVYLAPGLGDEMVMLYAFDLSPPFDEFISPGQDVLQRDELDGVRELEVAYDHGGKRWHQWFFWVPTAKGTVVVKAQAVEGSTSNLVNVAKVVRAGITVD